jgi:hypothetical protein
MFNTADLALDIKRTGGLIDLIICLVVVKTVLMGTPKVTQPKSESHIQYTYNHHHNHFMD